MPADFDKEVMILYAGRCSISLFEWYNYPNESTRVEKWNLVNSYKNCIMLDSVSHRLHDNRLLAMHPVST